MNSIDWMMVLFFVFGISMRYTAKPDASHNELANIVQRKADLLILLSVIGFILNKL